MICVAQNEACLSGVVERILSSGGSAEYVVCDLSVRESVGPMIDDVAEHCGRIDILVKLPESRRTARSGTCPTRISMTF